MHLIIEIMNIITYCWRWLFNKKVLQVYHQDSPGVRVLVKRNRWQRLTRDRTFSSIGEQHLIASQCWSRFATVAALRRVTKEFDEWLELTSDLKPLR